MNYSTLLLLATGIILFALFMNRKEEKEDNEKEGIIPEEKERDELPDLNDKFLENAKGRDVIDLVKVYNPQDSIVLRSILDSEGIETYVKSNHFGDLYPTYDLHNFATSVISIYKENSAAAKQIVEDYLLTLKKESYNRDSNLLENTLKTGSALAGIPPELSKFIPELLI